MNSYCKSENWHDAAKLFPLMDDAGLESLAADIAKNGLQNPIKLHQGKVLAGRNRLLACVKAGVEPKLEKWRPNGVSPLDFVIADNLERRHLTYDQRVALAAKLVPDFAEEAKKRVGGRPKKGEKPSAKVRGVSGKSAAQAARLISGVSTRSVETALALEKKKAGTLDRIIRGETTVAKADKEINSRGPLHTRYVVPPFTVLDARQGYWQERKRQWIALGIKGEKGRGDEHTASQPTQLGLSQTLPSTSVFDPVLCEVVYRWFCPPKGRVLDPFAGESTKGIVAAYGGYQYTGIEIRPEQVRANLRQAKAVASSEGARKHGMQIPNWIVGNSEALNRLLPSGEMYDLIFTSPPYYNLERYNGGKGDGSKLKTYDEFMEWYESVFRQAVARLKPNRFLVVKVGEIRDEKGFYRNFVGDNISCFLRLGLKYYNEAILVTPIGSLPLRDGTQFSNYRKLGKGHQNVLAFFKGDDAVLIPQELGVLPNGEA